MSKENDEYIATIRPSFNLIFEEPEMTQAWKHSLAALAVLQDKRISIYQEYYGTPDLRAEIGRVGGKISGVIRSHRTDLMMEILKGLKIKSPQSFKLFTLTTWRGLAVSLFGIAPAKKDLLALLDKGAWQKKRLTDNGWYPNNGVHLLLADHPETVQEINKFHDNYVKKFSEKAYGLRSSSDAVIAKIKDGA